MNTLKAMLIITLLSTSAAAMAEGGGDRTKARADEATAVAMEHYQRLPHNQAYVNAPKASSETPRTN
ncbi:hypothetical protein KV580_20185 [Pseudomonas chlororaphis]|nr:hypothetical protein [Pseudomonas chlororaphis]